MAAHSENTRVCCARVAPDHQQRPLRSRLLELQLRSSFFSVSRCNRPLERAMAALKLGGVIVDRTVLLYGEINDLDGRTQLQHV